MSYNLAGIRRRILIDKLDDEDFEIDVLDGFINDALRDIFSEYELPFTETMFTGNLPKGAYLFQFPDDVSLLKAVVVVDEEGNARHIKNNYLPFNEFIKKYPAPQSRDAAGITEWTMYGDKMMVSNPTAGNYQMVIYYNKVPKTLSDDNDVPELPAEFEEVLILGAFYRVQVREGDSDEALYTQQEYQRKMKQMASRYGYRVSGQMKMRNKQSGTSLY